MDLKGHLYRLLPGRIQPRCKRAYLTLSPTRLTPGNIQRSLSSSLFDNDAAYRSYLAELDESPFTEYRTVMRDRYDEHVGTQTTNEQKSISGGLDDTAARNLYAVVRSLQPSVVVETGVHYGHSTAYILAALSRNGHGHLHSVDPVAASSCPGDTEEPGWLVPETLRDDWTLHVGRSQRVLPELLPELGSVDLFLHDSDHSAPCMLFEFELAWEWLSERGLLVSDDIHWNDAFPTFLDHRDGDAGRLSLNAGYVRPSGRR